MDHCDECGFVYDDVDRDEVVAELREVGDRYRQVLSGSAGDDSRPELGQRPAPDVWSPLEYACHVRDVLFTQRERVLLALTVDTPEFFAMYRDERVDLAGYAEEQATDVLAGVDLGGRLLGHLFERLDATQLARPCIYPDPGLRDVLWVGRRTVHEIRHHRLDIERGLADLATGADR